MATYIGNAFSLQMLKSIPSSIRVEEIDPTQVPQDAVSCVGHTDIAAVVSSILGWEVPAQRVAISLEAGDILYVAQLMGGRLPEGATTLPEGFTLKFLRVEVE